MATIRLSRALTRNTQFDSIYGSLLTPARIPKASAAFPALRHRTFSSTNKPDPASNTPATLGVWKNASPTMRRWIVGTIVVLACIETAGWVKIFWPKITGRDAQQPSQ